MRQAAAYRASSSGTSRPDLRARGCNTDRVLAPSFGLNCGRRWLRLCWWFRIASILNQPWLQAGFLKWLCCRWGWRRLRTHVGGAFSSLLFNSSFLILLVLRILFAQNFKIISIGRLLQSLSTEIYHSRAKNLIINRIFLTSFPYFLAELNCPSSLAGDLLCRDLEFC